MKIKLIFSYDGSRFLGSASQPNKINIQDALSKALNHLGIIEKPLFASRTDKGVHAFRAVASVHCGDHFDDLLWLKNKINVFTKPYLYIKNIIRVNEDFQPRFDARFREYRYIFNHSLYDPRMSSYFYFYPILDLSQLNELLKLFIGKKDFKFFKKEGGDTKTTIRTIYDARAYRYKAFTIVTIKANSFLRSQIRLMLSAILNVLNNKITKSQLIEQINAKKNHSRTLIKPNGLYLSRIIY